MFTGNVTALLAHPVIAENDYLRKRGADVQGAAGNAGALGLKGLLRGFFPLIKPSALREVTGVLLTKHGVGPWARQPGPERRNELRAIFDLFDVDGTGTVTLADLEHAVREGAAALRENEDWPALAGKLVGHLRASGRRADALDFDQFAGLITACCGSG